MAKKNLKKYADEAFKDNDDLNKVWVTEDGQCFYAESNAKSYSIQQKFEDPEVFFRKGFTPEVDESLEDDLQASEDNVKALTATLDKVQDIANIEAEETPEISEGDHEALKIVAALREEHQLNVGVLAEVQEEIIVLRQFQASVVKLIDGNDTKLAQEIIKLIAVKTEE